MPHTGSEAWTRDLGYQTISPWQPWYYADEQVAGYTIGYQSPVTTMAEGGGGSSASASSADGYSSPGSLTYLTIKGAGHMVPQTNPEEALAMFSRFIAGKPMHRRQQD